MEMASSAEYDYNCPVCCEIFKTPVFYHVVTVSVKSVFNSSGEPRKLRSVLSAGEDPRSLILH